jgi:dimethylglycine dehydrogenase
MICGKLPKLNRMSLSYMLNDKGGIVSEFTITRLGDDKFYLMSAACRRMARSRLAREAHAEGRRHPHRQPVGALRLRSSSPAPKSRDGAGKVTEADLSNKAFPWLSAKQIEIGYARMLAMRVNYVGELGWELHVPMEQMVPIYDALWEAGQGVRHPRFRHVRDGQPAPGEGLSRLEERQ